MPPLTMPTKAKTAGVFSRMDRHRPRMITASIESGINHSKSELVCARSRPLAESCNPIQLSSTQGRQKQIITKAARLRLTRRDLSAAWSIGLSVRYARASYRTGRVRGPNSSLKPAGRKRSRRRLSRIPALVSTTSAENLFERAYRREHRAGLNGHEDDLRIGARSHVCK